VQGPLEVHRLLLERQAAHEIVHLPRPVVGADELPESLGLPASRCIAVRVLSVDGRPGRRAAVVAVAVPAGTWPSTAALAGVLGVRDVRPATSAETSAATDFAATLVCPVGLPAGLTLLLDRSLLPDEGEGVLYAPVGAAGVVLGLRGRDLLAVTRASVVDLAPGPANPWADRPSPPPPPGAPGQDPGSPVLALPA